MASLQTADQTASSRYTLVAIVLHWLLALALVGMFVMGLYLADLPFSPLRLKLLNWHKWAGITVLALSLLRLLWRASHRPPDLPAEVAQSMPRWQHLAHHGTHFALYALFFAVPLIGWAYSSAAGFPVVLFGQLALPDFVAPDKALSLLIKPWHKLGAFALAALVLLHVAAALKHQWIDRDKLVARMLPGRD